MGGGFLLKTGIEFSVLSVRARSEEDLARQWNCGTLAIFLLIRQLEMKSALLTELCLHIALFLILIGLKSKAE